MNEKNIEKPWELLNSNLASFVKLWKAAHESVLDFDWKKLPPFNLFLPQVDFLRVQSIMQDLSVKCDAQTNMLRKVLKKNPQLATPVSEFYQQVIPYLQNIGACANLLQQLAAFKQNKLAKKEVKAKDFNALLIKYENTVALLRVSSQQAQQKWGALKRSLSDNQAN